MLRSQCQGRPVVGCKCIWFWIIMLDDATGVRIGSLNLVLVHGIWNEIRMKSVFTYIELYERLSSFSILEARWSSLKGYKMGLKFYSFTLNKQWNNLISCIQRNADCLARINSQASQKISIMTEIWRSRQINSTKLYQGLKIGVNELITAFSDHKHQFLGWQW